MNEWTKKYQVYDDGSGKGFTEWTRPVGVIVLVIYQGDGDEALSAYIEDEDRFQLTEEQYLDNLADAQANAIQQARDLANEILREINQ